MGDTVGEEAGVTIGDDMGEEHMSAHKRALGS